MEQFLIEGGAKLQGEIAISGSKNSALPALAACLLTDEPVILHRIPKVRDIRTMEKAAGIYRRHPYRAGGRHCHGTCG
jgi:UDP-N-acetylglucosamine 1-carboxyvinyltransferase